MPKPLALLAALALTACANTPHSPKRTTHPETTTAPAPAPRPVPAPVPAPAAAPARAEDRCSLPPVTGRCKALFRRYHYDPNLGACREFVYGGCDGNANNFQTPAECLVACAATDDVRAAGEHWYSGHTVIGCKVGKDVYPSGATRVPQPADCNTCYCRAGDVTSPCTKRGCPGHPGCPDGTRVGTSCAQGGTADGCIIVETACLPICASEHDCRTSGHAHCVEGLCRTTHP